MSTVTVDNLKGKTTAKTVTVTVGAVAPAATQSLEQGLAKSLLNYNQITDTVIDSLNNSSVSDDAAAIFTATHINHYSDALYYPTTMSIIQNTTSRGGGTLGISGTYNPVSSSASITTSTTKFETVRFASQASAATATGGEYDRAIVITFGDLE